VFFWDVAGVGEGFWSKNVGKHEQTHITGLENSIYSFVCSTQILKVFMNRSPNEVFAKALSNYQQGQFQAAAQLLNALLEAKIVSPDILNLMASALFRLGDLQNAEKLFKSSLDIKVDYAQTYLHMAGFYRETQRLAQAVECYRKSYEYDAGNLQSLMDAALVLQQAEDWEQAEVLIDHYSAKGGDRFEALIRKAVCRYSLYDYQLAEELLIEAESLNPGQIITQYYFAQLYDKTKRKEQAEEIFSRLIEQGHEPSKFSLSLLYFSTGNWSKAFELYENRPVAESLKAFCSSLNVAYWDGHSDLKNQHVLVYAEQGLGDQIRYAYFLHKLILDAGRVSIIYDERLYPIIKQMYPSVNCIESESLTPEILKRIDPDYCTCVGSLGLVYGVELATRSETDVSKSYGKVRPYLSYKSSRNWLSKAETSKPLIGLSWRSIRVMKERAEWYCSADDFARLLEGLDATFVSLQHALSEEEKGAFEAKGIELVELEGLDLKNDQAELVSVISQLDHVISVSTALSELSGACGVPTSIFAIEDIRWFMSDTHVKAFYPQVKMFYKKMFGEWDEAFEQLRNVLTVQFEVVSVKNL
jgi:tetratricopeptide (TPR) repeat protein